jgi:hypothetical protein
MSAPGAPTANRPFSPDIRLARNNHISQSVNFQTRTITNVTTRQHEFYPGYVQISVRPVSGGGSVISVHGEGSGPWPSVNAAIGIGFFGGVAEAIATFCSAEAGHAQ